MKKETQDVSSDINRMEYAIKSFASAAIHATKAASEFSKAINGIKAIEAERKRKAKEYRINWIKYYILFGWVKELISKT